MLLSRVSVAVLLSLTSFSVVFGQRIRSRLEGQTVSTTSECNNLRQQSFYAQLDLFYFYLIEYETDMTLDLSNIERAVAMALLDTVKFRQCDESDQPQFGILLVQSAHQFATSNGVCDAVVPQGTKCRIVRGKTSILLDSDVNDVQSVAYAVIQRVLNDELYVQAFTGTGVVRSEFVREIGETLIYLTTNGQSDNTSDAPNRNHLKIVVAGTVAAIAIVCLICYGIYRKRKHEKGLAAVKAHIAHYQAKHRAYFQELQEEDRRCPEGWMTTHHGQFVPAMSITWSVSDLTSDSQSIRSSLQMERIDEEEAPSDEEAEPSPSSSPEKGSSLSSQPLFVAHWRVDSVPASRGDIFTTDVSLSSSDATPVLTNVYSAEDADAHTTDQSDLLGLALESDDEQLSEPIITTLRQTFPNTPKLNPMVFSDDEDEESDVDSPTPTLSSSETGLGRMSMSETESVYASMLFAQLGDSFYYDADDEDNDRAKVDPIDMTDEGERTAVDPEANMSERQETLHDTITMEETIFSPIVELNTNVSSTPVNNDEDIGVLDPSGEDIKDQGQQRTSTTPHGKAAFSTVVDENTENAQVHPESVALQTWAAQVLQTLDRMHKIPRLTR